MGLLKGRTRNLDFIAQVKNPKPYTRNMFLFIATRPLSLVERVKRRNLPRVSLTPFGQ